MKYEIKPVSRTPQPDGSTLVVEDHVWTHDDGTTDTTRVTREEAAPPDPATLAIQATLEDLRAKAVDIQANPGNYTTTDALQFSTAAFNLIDQFLASGVAISDPPAAA